MRLYELFLNAGGKTKALFGIIELSHTGYKVYILVAGFIALVLSIIAIKKKENKIFWQLALLLSLLSIALVFFRIWKLFI